MRIVGPIALIYLLTWGAIYTAFYNGWEGPALAVVSLWIPGLIALLSAWVLKVRLPIFKRPVSRYFTAPLWAVGLALIAIVLSLPFGQFAGPLYFEMLMASLKIPLTGGAAFFVGFSFYLLFAYLSGITLNALIALGEELMWRGLLWEQLKHLGLLRASLIIGPIWGAWHAPAIWLLGAQYQGAPLWVGSLMVLIVNISLTPILCSLRARGDSIAVAASFHGVLNAAATLAYLLFVFPNPLVVGISGLPGIVVCAMASGFLLWRSRRLARVCQES